MKPPECDGCGHESSEGSFLTLDWEGNETVEVRLCMSCRRVVAKSCGVPDPAETPVASSSGD